MCARLQSLFRLRGRRTWLCRSVLESKAAHGRAGERPSPFSAPSVLRPSSFPLSLPESVGGVAHAKRKLSSGHLLLPHIRPTFLLSARRRAAFVGRGRVIRRSEKESLERSTGKGTN